MSHICTHSEESSHPERDTMDLHIGSLHPWYSYVAKAVMDAQRDVGGWPVIMMMVSLGGVHQLFQMHGELEQDHLSAGEEPVLTTHWRLVPDAK